MPDTGRIASSYTQYHAWMCLVATLWRTVFDAVLVMSNNILSNDHLHYMR
ncbi:hypothetical protein MHIR_DE00638 [Candidatus Doolittlea endobia]|uniref:Uncharacterized protein n=1 Tax=Candidatus Doolittlea endobia TaxID=1778262 RepID=A0A143WT54_9ENTR|nr:hypothetical protein MHIR_DE00638 [Candidatus Doolittlea endobia]